jgi:FkbM family methyltransferase
MTMPLKQLLKLTLNGPLSLFKLQLVRRRRSDQHLYKICLDEAFAGVETPLALDIGAHKGETAAWILDRFPKTEVVSFEPTPESFRVLDALRGKYRFTAVNAAVGAENGSLDLHLSAHSMANSLLEMDPALAALDPSAGQASDQIKVPVVRLDDFLKENRLERPIDYMKLDVQGYEARVLQGASMTMSRVRFIMVEVQFNPVYKGSCRVDELCYSLYDAGFRLVRTIGYLPGYELDQLVSSDFFFARENPPSNGPAKIRIKSTEL